MKMKKVLFPKQDRGQKILTILLNHKNFQKELKKSRRRFLEKAKVEIKNGKEKLIAWNSKVLREEVSRLMEVFVTIPNSWEESIEEAIKTDVLNPPKSSTAPRVMLEKALPSDRAKLSVEVYKHTNQKEYFDAWNKVKKLQRKMREIRPKIISKSDFQIIRKYERGKTDFEIAREIAKDISPSTIRKIVSRKGRLLGVTPKTEK